MESYQRILETLDMTQFRNEARFSTIKQLDKRAALWYNDGGEGMVQMASIECHSGFLAGLELRLQAYKGKLSEISATISPVINVSLKC